MTILRFSNYFLALRQVQATRHEGGADDGKNGDGFIE